MRTIFFIMFWSCSMLFMPVIAQKKVALIIGNGNYSSPLTPLTSPTKDANAIDKVLKDLGFQTIVYENQNQSGMKDAIRNFKQISKNADIGVFFYSGHAQYINSNYYIIPCGIQTEVLESDCVPISDIQKCMRQCKLSIYFMDACRDINYALSSETKGGRVIIEEEYIEPNLNDQTPRGEYFCYASGFGQKANGVNNNSSSGLSPFTEALTKHLYENHEFRTVWQYRIVPEVKELTKHLKIPQIPQTEGGYSGNFYFNKKTRNPIIENKIVDFKITPASAKLYIDGKKQESQSISFNMNKSYSYQIKADGYQTFSDILNVDKDTPSELSLSLKPLEKANIIISGINCDANCILDGKPVKALNKGESWTIESTIGEHTLEFMPKSHLYEYRAYNIKITSNYYQIAPILHKTTLYQRYFSSVEYFDWDDDGKVSINYHFSPDYQIGLNVLYRPEGSRLSYGAFVSTSTGFYKNWGAIELYSYSSISTSTEVNIELPDGTITGAKKISTTESGRMTDKYSEHVDPYGEAKKYNSNALVLFNMGFNPCNGFMLEAGIGFGYHKKKYHMGNCYNIIKSEYRDLNTDELYKTTYEYLKTDESAWYEGKSKWSPAIRLGGKFDIPICDYDYAIQLGGGYTYLPTNHKFSSWDASIGFAFFF